MLNYINNKKKTQTGRYLEHKTDKGLIFRIYQESIRTWKKESGVVSYLLDWQKLKSQRGGCAGLEPHFLQWKCTWPRHKVEGVCSVTSHPSGAFIYWLITAWIILKAKMQSLSMCCVIKPAFWNTNTYIMMNIYSFH